MNVDKSRMPCLDAFKALACLLIVLHHLAVYGPMSDVAYPLISGVIDGLYQYGRMAVQIFLVIAGFLSAKNLAPYGVPQVDDPLGAIRKRYERLILPYLAALTLAVICAALARHWMDRDYIPATPDFLQLIAHALLLQDLLDQEALSAGVWYVAIDFQLFAVIAILLWVTGKVRWRRAEWTAPLLVAGLAAVSLFVFNRNEFWDKTALYFFGSYGLGALSYWASNRERGWLWLLALAALAGAALAVDFRPRIAVSATTMLVLGFARRYMLHIQPPEFKPVTYLGRASYSIFLVHFPLCMLINAIFARFFPHQPVVNILGMLLALAVSVVGGILFFRWVESRTRCAKTRFPILAGFMASSLFAVGSNA